MTDYASEFRPTAESTTDYAAEFRAPSQKTIATKTAGDMKSSINLDNSMENFAAGMGRGAMQVARGAKQLIDKPAMWLESVFGETSKLNNALGTPSAKESAAQTDLEVEEAKKLDAPLMDTKAGMAGSFTGGTAATLLPLGAIAKYGRLGPVAKAAINPTTYKAAAGAGALQGALEPTTKDESKVGNTVFGALGGMGGNAIINSIGKVAQPVRAKFNQAYDKAVQVLENNGITLDAAQKTGSTFLNKVRSSFSDNPFTASEAAAGRQEQQNQFNKAVLQKAGVEANAATPEVMRSAADKISDVFEDVLGRNKVQINDVAKNKLSDIEKEASSELGKTDNPIAQQAQRIRDAVNEQGVIEGQTAYAIKKSLDRISNTQDSTLKYHALKLNSALKDALHDSLSGADQEAFSKARLEFSNLKKIEDAVAKDGSGDISPSRLASVVMQKRNRQAGVYGRGNQELVELAHAGNMLLPDKHPNSGTAARLAMQVGLPLLAGGGAGVYTSYEGGDTEEALLKAGGAIGATYLGPKLAAKSLANSKVSNYLKEGVKPTLLRDLLLLPQKNDVVGAVSKRAASEEAETPIRNMVGGRKK